MSDRYPWDQHRGAGDDRPPIWKADEDGKTVIGVVTRIWTYTKDAETSTPVLHLDTDDGAVSVWASQTMLRQALAEEDPQIGDKVKITYVGTRKLDSGNTLKEFEVIVKHAPSAAPVEPEPVAEEQAEPTGDDEFSEDPF